MPVFVAALFTIAMGRNNLHVHHQDGYANVGHGVSVSREGTRSTVPAVMWTTLEILHGVQEAGHRRPWVMWAHRWETSTTGRSTETENS